MSAGNEKPASAYDYLTRTCCRPWCLCRQTVSSDCAFVCKFSLTSVYIQNVEFNIPFFGLQRIFLHLMLFGKPVLDIPRTVTVLTVLRKSPFCTLILTVSGPDMHHITTQNGPFRSVIKAVLHDEENTVGILLVVSICLTVIYRYFSFLRFSEQNPVANDFTRILRDFHDENLTFPAALFVFLYIHVFNMQVCVDMV